MNALITLYRRFFPLRTFYRGWRIEAGGYAAIGTRLTDGEHFVVARLRGFDKVLRAAKRKVDRLENFTH